MRTNTQLSKIDTQIAKIKAALTELGEMRPGTLTRQYRDPKTKMRAFWQLSYTYNAQSCSAYIRQDALPTVRKQIATYRKFKRLTDQWVALAIKRAELLRKGSPVV